MSFKSLSTNPKLYLALELVLHAGAYISLFLFWEKLNPAWIAVAFFWSLFLLTFGQEIAAHRYFSHDAFQCSKTWRWLFHVLMAMGNFGPALDWRVVHIVHHQNSDREGDPTSPRRFGFFGIYSNFWKWQFVLRSDERVGRAIHRIVRETPHRDEILLARRLHPVLTLIYVGLLASFGAVPFVVFFSIPNLLISFTLNSISYFAHHHSKGDHPQNRPWLNLVSMGGGWHKAHHELPNELLFHPRKDFVGLIANRIFKRNSRDQT